MARVYITLPKGTYLTETDDVYPIPGTNRWSLPEGTTEVSIQAFIKLPEGVNTPSGGTRLPVYLVAVPVEAGRNAIRDRIDAMVAGYVAGGAEYGNYPDEVWDDDMGAGGYE